MHSKLFVLLFVFSIQILICCNEISNTQPVKQWTISQVSEWLETQGQLSHMFAKYLPTFIGLGKYKKDFEFHQISGQELMQLTDELLQKPLNVHLLAHRMKILNFIKSHEEVNIQFSHYITKV